MLERERLREFDICLGAPLQFPEGKEGQPTTIDVPRVPHVFYCTDLYLIQPDEAMEVTSRFLAVIGNDSLRLPRASILYEKGAVSAIYLTCVMVMLGHAVTSGRGDQSWRFVGSGQAVSDSVKSYQSIACDFHWPPLDAVIACRPGSPHSAARSGDVLFRRTAIPVIRPASPAVVKNEGMYESAVKRGVGATLYVQADAWEDVQWWLNYWSSFSRAQTVPEWARTQPRKTG